MAACGAFIHLQTGRRDRVVESCGESLCEVPRGAGPELSSGLQNKQDAVPVGIGEREAGHRRTGALVALPRASPGNWDVPLSFSGPQPESQRLGPNWQ